MPTRPEIKALTNASVDVLNAIRNSASINYKNYVPIATPNAEVIKSIGAVIMDNPALQNEFLSALVNRIGKVLLTSRMYSNPWARFKRGMLDFGETIEEIFVDIAKPFQFDPAVAETNVFKREHPNVKSAFHIMNYQKFYKSTIQQNELKNAFLSWDGVTNLIAKIVDAMYTAANYDEFLTMKYMLACHILDGHLAPIYVGTISSANMKAVTSTIKSASNTLEFLSTEYNLAGVHQHTEKRRQYLISTAEFDATMDVEVLASAFNMNKAEFLGQRVLIDGFDKLDTDRLSELFADDPNYRTFTSAELSQLASVPAILIDEDYFMVLDSLNEFTEQYNGEGLYWNYFYHAWKVFSVSPFSNAVIFTTTEPTASAVSVTPSTATIAKGGSVQLTATVTTAGFAKKSVIWSISPENAGVTVSNAGIVSATTGATSGNYTVTATATADATVTDTATITVS